MTNYFYRAFNLILQSDVICPTLEVVEPQKADVIIQQECLSHLQTDHQYHGHPGRLFFHIPGIATFDVRDGNTILIDLSDCEDMALAQVYLTGSALGSILHQRGLLVLHGNAIALNDEEAVIFVGQSGAGKSTTANAFMRAGFEILSDDVSAIEFDAQGQAWVMPAYPSIKLWLDAAERDYDINGLTPIAHRENKFYVKAEAKFCHGKRKVKAVYLLEAGLDFEATPLQGVKAFDELHQQVYRPYFVYLLGQQKQCFTDITRLAKSVEFSKLTRPLNHSHQALINLVTQAKLSGATT